MRCGAGWRRRCLDYRCRGGRSEPDRVVSAGGSPGSNGPCMTLPEAFNYVEVGLWPLMGGVLAAYGVRRRGPDRRDSLVAAAVLVAFGASDWFEANTLNEWWHP